MAHQLRGHAESLAALGTLVPFGLCVDSAVVFKSHKVSELLQAKSAGEEARFVAVFVVEEGGGMAVGAAAVLANVGLVFCVFRRKV